MIQISVANEIQQAITKLKTIAEAQQFKFAVSKALNQTAYEIQQEVRKNIPSRFILRRQWIVTGIQVTKSNKANLTATIYSRDKFMGLQEFGGPKDPRGHFIAIPTSAVRRTKTDMIKKSDRPRELGDQATIIDYKGHKWLALRSGKYHKRLRDSGRLRLMYLLVPRAQVKERLGLGKDAMRIASKRFTLNLEAAIADALKTAR